MVHLLVHPFTQDSAYKLGGGGIVGNRISLKKPFQYRIHPCPNVRVTLTWQSKLPRNLPNYINQSNTRRTRKLDAGGSSLLRSDEQNCPTRVVRGRKYEI